MVSYDLPNSRPLQPDAVHVVVGDFHNLLQAEHPRLVCWGQLIHGHRTQPPHEVHWKQINSNTRWITYSQTEILYIRVKNDALTNCISIESGGTSEDPANVNVALVFVGNRNIHSALRTDTDHAFMMLLLSCIVLWGVSGLTCPQLPPHSESWSLLLTPGCEPSVSCPDFPPGYLQHQTYLTLKYTVRQQTDTTNVRDF